MDSTYIQTTTQTFRCELDTDLETFDRAFCFTASGYAHYRELHLKRIFGDGLIGDYGFLLQGDLSVCRVEAMHYRPGRIQVTIERMIPIKGGGWPLEVKLFDGTPIAFPSETGTPEKLLTGGMVVTLWVIDWIAKGYRVRPEPETPLSEHAQWERAQIGDGWQSMYMTAARGLKRVDSIWQLLERYELIASVDADQVTTVDQGTGGQVPKRTDVKDRVMQAHEHLKTGDTPSAVFRGLVHIEKGTYTKYCRGVTGEEPLV